MMTKIVISTSIRNQDIRQMGRVSFKKSYGGGELTGGDVSDATSLATPRQRVGVDSWTFNDVDTVSTFPG